MAEIKDHLGNKYQSITQMCKYYGIQQQIFKAREKKGWSLEDCLTKSCFQVKDHLGNTFKNNHEMCKYWGVNYALYRQRRYKLGYSIKESLTSKKNTVLSSLRRKKCTDHLGNEYESISQMCEHYGISINLYIHRLGCENWSLKDVLTMPADKRRRKVLVKDHLGNEFINIKEMCKYWNVKYYTFLKRKHQYNYTLKDCLTKKTKRGITDHLGNKYKSIKELAEAYNIDYTLLKSRITKNVFNGDIEKILMEPKLSPKEQEWYLNTKNFFINTFKK